MHLFPAPLKTHNPKRGFSLIELLVTIAIVAVIASVGIISFNQSQRLGRDTRRKQDLRSLAVALELYYQTNDRYPCSGTASGSFAFSSDSDWLTDETSCGGTGVNLAPTYINKVPVGPNGNVNNDRYFYRSDGAAFASCTAGHWYYIYTFLENPQDPERVAAQNPKPYVCYWNGWSSALDNAFLIGGP